MDIRVHGLGKKYILKEALKNVSVEFKGGLVHALVGENGAGKSTLAKILSGLIRPSSGQIYINEKEVSFKSSKDALHHSIVTVNQTPLLASSLTAKENIRLILRDTKKLSVELTDLKNKWCPTLNLNSYVRDLGGNLRFYTALLGALLRDTDCIILDEPSAFLETEERKNLYMNLRDLASKGKLIIVITHSKAEATTYANTVTWLKEGNLFYHFESGEEYKAYLKYLDNLKTDKNPGQNSREQTETNSPQLPASPCFVLENAKAKPKNKPLLQNVNLSVDFGQICAVSGMREAALDTLEDLCTGLMTERVSGKALFYSSKKNALVKLKLRKGQLNTKFLRKNKTAIVCSDRTFRCSSPELTIEQLVNTYQKKSSREFTQEIIRKADVKITPEEKAYSLSGGMLQRIILERELSMDPKLIILANPMQGLDINAQSLLCKRLVALKEQGKAILIIGVMDFPLTLCQKVYSLEDGSTKLTWEVK